MKTKQANVEQGSVQNLPQTNTTEQAGSRNRNLFIKVETFDMEGRTIGTRIVDMYHIGTRAWMEKHHWWAFHNNHQVESKVADDDEVEAYMVAQKAALAEKFNAERAHVAA